MNWLIISWYLSLGLVPQQADLVGQSRTEIDPSRIATVMDVGLEFQIANRLKLFSSIESYQYKALEGLGFNPYRTDYSVRAELQVTSNVTLIAQHECDHPVVSLVTQRPRYEYLSQETQLYVKISGSTK